MCEVGYLSTVLTRISDTARATGVREQQSHGHSLCYVSLQQPGLLDCWGVLTLNNPAPSKSSSPDFKHSEKTFNRNWRPPNFLPISRSFFSFAFFFPSLSSSGSTVQSWITKPSPKFCGIKKKTSREAPAVTGTQRERHTCIYQHTSTLPL